MAIKGYTAEENAAYRQKKQAEIEDMFKRIDEGVKAVFTSEKYGGFERTLQYDRKCLCKLTYFQHYRRAY